MTILAATPYFILNGKAEQAIEFYQQALRAKTETVMRFGDVDKSCPDAQRNRIMHAALKVGNALLMLSDGVEGQNAQPSSSVNVALDFDNPEELHRTFAALSAGGKVEEPVMDAPWGALFGAATDKFGVSWMFNFTKKQG